MPPTRRRGRSALAIALLALAGQLALLADGAIAHVTCAVHGDLVHATARDDAPAPPASATTTVAAATVASDDDAHDRCLVDEDGEVACRPEATTLAVPTLTEIDRDAPAPRDRAPTRRAPLYRLAPKNSPPA
ncbi:MAG TPA: hypothetical protein VHJ20_20265 [Polyangia bacterium]|nr:hypothetical protein [Polyangia bacterium]